MTSYSPLTNAGPEGNTLESFSPPRSGLLAFEGPLGDSIPQRLFAGWSRVLPGAIRSPFISEDPGPGQAGGLQFQPRGRNFGTGLPSLGGVTGAYITFLSPPGASGEHFKESR
jgi:hypothetical protein